MRSDTALCKNDGSVSDGLGYHICIVPALSYPSADPALASRSASAIRGSPVLSLVDPGRIPSDSTWNKMIFSRKLKTMKHWVFVHTSENSHSAPERQPDVYSPRLWNRVRAIVGV